MNYKQWRIRSLVVLTVVLLLLTGMKLSYGWICVPAIIFLFIIIRGVIQIQRNFFINSINHLPEPFIDNKPAVCLTFDDGIHPELTNIVLDILRTQEVKAMFFIIGRQISGNEHILRRIDDEGHLIGNHSDSHAFWFDLWSAESMLKDMLSMNRRVAHVLGKSYAPVYFRPPYGVTNPNVAKAIRQSKMKSVGWDLRSMDTVARSKEEVLETLKKKTRAGCIVLLHDRCRHTVDTLTDYIVFCKSQGYTFTTL